MKYFNGKTVLITGHTGFKGSWLSIWLSNLGAKVVGVSNDLISSPSNYSASFVKESVEDYRLDIRNVTKTRKLIEKVQPDFVFHLAAQALVRVSYENPIETFSTNALGTASVMEAVRTLSKKVILIMITSDKVYDNVEWSWGYREIDRLGGKDPYSASKGMAELTIKSYYESFFNDRSSNVIIGVARAGNVIGGGDWALDRIVPDCITAWSKGDDVNIRNPHATRPWQHVLEPLSGYLSLALNLSADNSNNGEAYNFGPSADKNYSVNNLIEEMSKYWELVKWNDVSIDQVHLHEAALLKLNCDKALADLGWRSTLNFEETVKMTVEWYKYYYHNENQSMLDFSINQINEYVEIASLRDIKWASNNE